MVRRRRALLASLVAVLASAVAAVAPPARAKETAHERLPVVIPDGENLQYLGFWVALGAGYFADEGFTVEPKSPDTPGETEKLLESGAAEVAVLPPPIYLQLM